MAGLDIERLYRSHGDLVLGRCRTLLGNEIDAQDAMQEVFLQVFRYRDAFRGEAKPTTYLYKVATNVCLNRMRTKRRRPEDPVEELPPTHATDSLLDALEVRQLVDKLLADEDDRTRGCVIYHYVDGLTHEEAGELLGISAAAVRKRIGVFRQKIKDNPPDWLDAEPLDGE